MREAEAAARAVSPSGAETSVANWTLVGPQPSNQSIYGFGVTSGRVTAIAVDPTTSGASTTIYLGAAEGGVWKSTNNGSTWTPLTDSQSTLAIGSIAIDPNNHNIIYAGTGEENFSLDSYYGGGILKSTNGGATWTMLGAETFGGPISSPSYYGGGSYIGGVAVQPGVTGTPVLLAAAEFSSSATSDNSGIWRSTDGGATWTHVCPSGTNSFTMGTSVLWVSSTTAYATLGNSLGSIRARGLTLGVYVSTDSGATWTPANGSTGHALPPPTSYMGRTTLVAAPSNPLVLYTSIEDYSTGGLLGMYKTSDGGVNWDPILTPLGTGSTSDFCGIQCAYDMVLAVSPTNANVLYAGGSIDYSNGAGGLYVTTNGGTTGAGAWAELDPGTNGVTMHPDFHALAFSGDGNTLYVGNDGGVWRGAPTNSLTTAWTDLNSGLAITEFYPGLSIYPGSKNIAINGTQGNGTQLYNGSPEWNVVACTDGAWTAIDPGNSNYMYTGCSSSESGPWRSLTGGGAGSWTLIGSGINSADAIKFIPPMVMDPNSPTTLYYGTENLYKMTNATGSSPSWTVVNSSPLLAGSPLTTIAVSPVNGNNIFVGMSNGSAGYSAGYSSDGGVTLTPVKSILPNRFVTMAQGDPKISTTFYVTVSGFSGFNNPTYDGVGHVFQCTITSNTCTDISGNLPNTPANDIVIDPNIPNTYYVATDIGVFTTSNGGTTWSTAGAGLPNVAVVSLKLHEASRTLRAATHGRSTWDLSVPVPSPATITSPTNDSTLPGATATFIWTAGVGVSQYSLYIGTTAGAHDIDFVNAGTATSHTVTNLPVNGEKIYVTLYSLINEMWHSNSYTYVAFGRGTAATMTAPTSGSKLPSTSATFQWAAGSGISQYSLYIGTTAGAHDIDYVNAGTMTSHTVTNLPNNGVKIYVTLYSLNGATWLQNGYTYIASGTGTSATMTAPVSGSKLTSATATFQWTAGSGISQYSLYIGSTAGAHDIDYVNAGSATSHTVTNLPTNGEKIYVTLYSLNGTTWLQSSYTYIASGTAAPSDETSRVPAAQIATETSTN